MSKISAQLVINLLQPDVLVQDVETLCQEALLYKYGCITIPPLFVLKAKDLLKHASTSVATVIGYPYGYHAIESKLAEMLLALVDGADEIQITANTTAIKNNDWQYIANELNTLVPIVKRKGKVVTVILETVLLSQDEIVKACDIYGASGVDCLQSGTGIIDVEASASIPLLRKHLADAVKIIASVNQVSYSLFKKYLQEGADRVSTREGLALLLEESALN